MVGLINSHTKMQDVGDVLNPVAKGFRKMIKNAIADYINEAYNQSKSVEEFKEIIARFEETRFVDFRFKKFYDD